MFYTYYEEVTLEDHKSVYKKYQDAVDSFVEKVKKDINVIAVLLYGSLAYDTVWEKSDIDISIIIRDQKIETSSYAVDENNIIINVSLISRTTFMRSMERAVAENVIARGKIIYCTDESLIEFFEENKLFGQSDIELAIFHTFPYAHGLYEKAYKWLKVKEDLLYSRLYILKASEPIASMEILRLGDGETPGREAVLRALELNRPLMEAFYIKPLTEHHDVEKLYELLNMMNEYFKSLISYISAPVLDYMADHEVKTITMLSKHFHMDSHAISHIFEFLQEEGIIERVNQTIRITPKGRPVVEELAYLYP